MPENESKIASVQPSQATPCGSSSAIGCSALNKRWRVAEAGSKYFMNNVWGGKPVRYETTCEDMSILTEDGEEEVIGCSEWMRADREVFDHIVALHNANLPNPTGLHCAGLGVHKQDPVVGRSIKRGEI